MIWLVANFISTMEVRQKEIAGSSMQSPILIQIGFSTSDGALLTGIQSIFRLCYHIKGERLILEAFYAI